MHIASAFIFFCFFLPSLLAQQQCPVRSDSLVVNHVIATQGSLLKDSAEEMPTEISTVAQGHIRAFKDSLVALVDAVMSCTAEGTSPESVQKTLSALLPKHPSSANQTSDEVYGTDLEAAVTTPTNFPALRVIQIHFGIGCGYDSLLLFYEARLQSWQLRLRWQRKNYDQPSGAFGDFVEYTLLPQANGRDWRVVVAHGHPWCTSRWSSFEMDLIAPAAAPTSPRVLWHEEGGYVRETTPRMRTTKDGFELRLDVGTIESGVMVRKGVLRYRVKGETVERVQPIATNARGFVDAWLQSPWIDAQKWTAASAIPEARNAHEDFTRERAKHDLSASYEYGPVRNCNMRDRAQVEIDRTPGDPTYYLLASGDNSFTVESVSNRPDSRCSGSDIMKTQ